MHRELWHNLSPQASSMDVHNPPEACGYSYNGCSDARRPAYECPFFAHSQTLNFELMWRRKYKKRNIDASRCLWALYYGCRPNLMSLGCIHLAVPSNCAWGVLSVVPTIQLMW